jgi:TonB family protein
MRPSHAVRTPDPDLEDARDDGGALASAALPASPRPFTLAVSVETVFAGTSIVTRLLPALHEDRRARSAPRLLTGGVALIALAFAIFTGVTMRSGAERVAPEGWKATGRGPASVASPATTPGARALDVLFIAALLGGGLLVSLGLHRRAPERRTCRRSFTIGTTDEADAPVDASFISAPAHELVTPDGIDYVVHPTSHMSGLVEADGQTSTLAELSSGSDLSFRLPPRARAEIVCGRTMFVVRSFRRPPPLPRPRRGPDPAELPYAIGAGVALGLFVLMIFTIPPDPRALTFDLLASDSRLLAFHIAPPAAPSEAPPWIPQGAASPAAAPMIGASGSTGDRALTANRNNRRRGALASAASSIGSISDKVAPDDVRERGILGILAQAQGRHVQAILGSGSGLGDLSATDEVLGHLAGTQVGSAWGVGGLDSVGTGQGGGGTGDGILGVGHLDTFGKGGPGGPSGGSGYGHGVGRLDGRRRMVAPDIITGIADVRGSLDKEIIRRIIHRHLNEVRFCYEEQLARQPHLGGRVGVQFTISGRGQVIASVLQSSTLANRAVETCTVNAVRRWEFPQPQGGGLVMVSYPFLFTPPP